ncbi:hypothetical protein Dsin_001642 [Dipteronia sinensis]|uniref:Cation/H+ exchanger transmembrane domain-containing protein n=1 Tax=Dipteronia sinensis TaxID=43782 RepID=A0AAE0EIN3_9ROSI|nr:hypothetical protein Dsin_001642 [Dipteronia sinensis]
MVCQAFTTIIDDSKGIWFEDYLSNTIFPVFMVQLILSFFFSKLIYYVLRPLKQPKFVSNVLTGMILGPSVMGRNKKMLNLIFQPENMLLNNTISAIAGIYFIFINSVKMDKSRILPTAKKSWHVGLTCFVVPWAISIFVYYQLQDNIPGIVKGNFPIVLLALSCLSFIPVIAHALEELNLLTSELGNLAISSATVHEIIGWCLTSLAILTQGPTQGAAGWMMGVNKNTPEGKPVNGTYVRAILLAPLITGVLSDGALIMGLIIPAGPPLGSQLVEKCELILSEILLPFLYIRIGLLTNVYSITNRDAFSYLHMTLVSGYLGKVAGSLLSMLFFKTSLRNAFLLAFIMNIKGVLELTISMRWRMYKYVDEPTYTAFVLSNVLVSAIMAPLIQIFYKPQTRLGGSDSTEICTRTVQATPHVSQLRVLCCIHCEDNVPGIITLLNAMKGTENGPIGSYAVHLTELTGRAMPLLEPYESKNMRQMRDSTARIMKALSKYSKSSNFSVTFQPFRIIAPYKIMHGFICKLAQDESIPLIILPFPESLEVHGKTTSLRSLNMGVEEQSPCTVGIFVDRCPPRYLGLNRVAFQGEFQENYGEKHIDDILVNEFMAKNIRNPCVEYHELEANEPVQVLDTIRSVENKYDLFVVGKRRGPKSRLDQDMSPWVDYQELGVIGDMLCIFRFRWGIHVCFGYALSWKY